MPGPGPSAPFNSGLLWPEYRHGEGGRCGASYLMCPIADRAVRSLTVRGTRICDRQVWPLPFRGYEGATMTTTSCAVLCTPTRSVPDRG